MILQVGRGGQGRLQAPARRLAVSGPWHERLLGLWEVPGRPLAAKGQ